MWQNLVAATAAATTSTCQSGYWEADRPCHHHCRQSIGNSGAIQTQLHWYMLNKEEELSTATKSGLAENWVLGQRFDVVSKAPTDYIEANNFVDNWANDRSKMRKYS